MQKTCTHKQYFCSRFKNKDMEYKLEEIYNYIRTVYNSPISTVTDRYGYMLQHFADASFYFHAILVVLYCRKNNIVHLRPLKMLCQTLKTVRQNSDI